MLVGESHKLTQLRAFNVTSSPDLEIKEKDVVHYLGAVLLLISCLLKLWIDHRQSLHFLL